MTTMTAHPEHGETRTFNGHDYVWQACNRCAGTGSFGPLVVDGGRCFDCPRDRNGRPTGGVWMEVSEAERLEKRRASDKARRERKAAEFVAGAEARYAALIEAHPLLAELNYLSDTRPGEGYGGILGDMRSSFERKGALSVAQITFAEKLIREDIETATAIAAIDFEETVAVLAPEGRVTVTGEVTNTDVKYVYTPTGEKGRCVMTVKLDDGSRVWGTIPRDLDGGLIGTRIEFTATFERSEDDETFAFFNRPAKARKL